ncbi:hypothetical protein BJX76DRAFT_354972 [Aspergillus varians]
MESVRRIFKKMLRKIMPRSQEEHKALRCAMRRHLREIFNTLKEQPIDKVSVELASEPDIWCKELKIQVSDQYTGAEAQAGAEADCPVYFKPWPAARLDMYSINPNCRRTLEPREEDEGCLTDTPVEYTDIAELLHGMMVCEFGQYSRAGLDDSPPSDFDDRFLLDRYSAFGNATDSELVPWSVDLGLAWDRAWGEEKKPHVTFTMMHHVFPTRQLLRTEILTIIGVTITRFRTSKLKGHRVIPHLTLSAMPCQGNLISVFDQYKARIVQAHMVEDGLMILQSQLYDFSTPEKRKENIPIFLCYMACEPIGDTENLRYEMGRTSR